MIIVKEKKPKNEDTFLEGTQQDYDFLLYQALCKMLGTRPLPREQWTKNLDRNKRRIIPFLKRISQLPV